MAPLNFHHLHLFRTVARAGTLARAATQLGLTEPTVSTQIKALEQQFGQPLFSRALRRLQLTDAGQTALRYADDIFSLSDELSQAIAGQPAERPRRLLVGVADVVPKLIAYRLVEPALHAPEGIVLSCTDDTPERLIAALAVHALDVLITDAPITPPAGVRAFNHLLGESGTTIFGATALAAKHRDGFPASLHGAPFLLPLHASTIRRALDAWFQQQDVRPAVTGEFADSALLKVFGQNGYGLFAAPTVLETEIQRQHDLEIVGRLPEIKQQFYAISVERRIEHPAVTAIVRAAHSLFASS
ncbi:MAG TPA: LysR family transcriptional regulator [Gemmatimonadaceae bacterium]|nr:LysR family transcriptional regulator [Gemmatimonadaceae bacterium]